MRWIALPIGLGVFASTLSAQPSEANPRDVGLFTISKSENKNQVQFALHVDEHCAPVGDAPVHAYWRMLEKGPSDVEPLLLHELPAYGIASQTIVSKGKTESAMTIVLRALPGRRLDIHTFTTPNGCAARAETIITGHQAVLYNAHATLRWPFGIDNILITGRSLADDTLVRETVR